MPGTIPVICPACDARMTAPAESAGRRSKCPRCRASITVGRTPADVDDLAAAALRDDTPVTDWRPAPRAAPAPPPEPPGLPTPRPDPPGVPVPRVRPAARGPVPWHWVLVGMAVPVVVGAAAVGLTVGRDPAPARDRVTAPPPPAPPPPPSPEAVAKNSFEDVAGRVRSGLVYLPDEPLPPSTSFDWDIRSSLDMTFTGDIGPDRVARVPHELRGPDSGGRFRGVVRFRAKVKGELAGAFQKETFTPGDPFPRVSTYRFRFDAELKLDGVAEYEQRAGGWELDGVRLTVADRYLRSKEETDKNLFSALVAHQMNEDAARANGRPFKLPADRETGLGRLLREAVRK